MAPATSPREHEQEFRSGFVAVIGRPNVGKSTLVNRLVGRTVAIVSDKAQTTRHRIMGVVHLPAAQIVLLDTPGIHRPRHLLGRWMLQVAERSLKDADLVLFMVDGSSRRPGPGDTHVAQRVASARARAVLVINKMDLVPPGEGPAVTAAYEELGDFVDTVPISARTGAGTDRLLELIVDHLPPGPPYFPPGMHTDQPERVLAAEFIREQVLHLTRDEVPHAVGVDIEEMTPRSGGKVYIRAVIYVERESQKGILIGQGGNLLKAVGSGARERIETLLGEPVYLDLWVKVSKKWRDRAGSLRALGFRQE
ncbi:MAG TPA: GTPase Era [Sphingobacteriaceae bacterium]|nr:GTPase Era [Sphingobacteriaceae bacterium]